MAISTIEKTSVQIPNVVFKSMVKMYEAIEEFNHEFEDFLLAHNNSFIKKMRKARKEHLEGKAKNINLLKI